MLQGVLAYLLRSMPENWAEYRHRSPEMKQVRGDLFLDVREALNATSFQEQRFVYQGTEKQSRIGPYTTSQIFYLLKNQITSLGNNVGRKYILC